jgi:deoxyribodipyrimidine photo-lyase
MIKSNNRIHLHIFRRDFRLKDNTALYEAWAGRKGSSASSESRPKFDKILGVFIFTPQQVTDKNDYRSQHAIQFMVESLQSLNKEMDDNLLLLYGDETDVLEQLLGQDEIVSVSWNRDYTPYSKKRDKEMKKSLDKNNIYHQSYHDLYLVPPAEGFIHPSSKPPTGVYTVFTPFYDAVEEELNKRTPEIKPSVSRSIEWASLDSLNLPKKIMISLDDALVRFVGDSLSAKVNVEGGRDAGMYRISKIKQGDFDKYGDCRDCLTYETTYLSAYLKFGCVSVREAYHAMKSAPSKKAGKDMIRELIWRDYFGHILNRYPRILGEPYSKKFKKIKWENNRKNWEAWKAGKTGFPIVDAGMRQMNNTGYMHNRCRMIVSSFLVKLLRIDWRKGERYFAQQLVDYDVASNNGGWQDSAGSGAGAQPYFRIFNPWTQIEKYDSEGKYIKKWVPELEHLSGSEIQNWYKPKVREKCRDKFKDKLDYPDPIIDYKEERKNTLAKFKKELN